MVKNYFTISLIALLITLQITNAKALESDLITSSDTVSLSPTTRDLDVITKTSLSPLQTDSTNTVATGPAKSVTPITLTTAAQISTTATSKQSVSMKTASINTSEAYGLRSIYNVYVIALVVLMNLVCIWF